jgi:hypothetical protein
MLRLSGGADPGPTIPHIAHIGFYFLLVKLAKIMNGRFLSRHLCIHLGMAMGSDLAGKKW